MKNVIADTLHVLALSLQQ